MGRSFTTSFALAGVGAAEAERVAPLVKEEES
jgi:hypothetical protein